MTETNKQHSGSVIDGFFSCFVCVNSQCSSRIIDTFVCYSKGKNTVFKNYLNYLYKLYRVQNGSNKIVANKSKQCVSFVFLPYVFDEELCCTARLNKHLKLESLQSHAFHSEVAALKTLQRQMRLVNSKNVSIFWSFSIVYEHSLCIWIARIRNGIQTDLNFAFGSGIPLDE